MYESARGAVLFEPTWENDETGMDAVETHLAQMVAVFGPFPQSLLATGNRT